MDYYGTIAGADAYFAARGVLAWAGEDDAKLAALVRASGYIDAYAGKPAGAVGCVMAFPGKPTGGRDQGLAWPRTGATDREGEPIAADVVPREVEQATYEAALRELIALGSLSPDYVPGTRVKRSRAGDSGVETEFFEDSNTAIAAQSLAPVVTTVGALLAGVMSVDCPIPWAIVV